MKDRKKKRLEGPKGVKIKDSPAKMKKTKVTNS
jgi:hypothetical protein